VEHLLLIQTLGEMVVVVVVLEQLVLQHHQLREELVEMEQHLLSPEHQ
jgi:hypothetical protein